MAGRGNFNHVNPGKKKWGVAYGVPWGTSLGLSGPFDSGVLSNAHSINLLFPGTSQSKDHLRIDTSLSCRPKKEPFVCLGPLNNRQPQMDFFLERISSSVCFLIETRDYVPSFHLTFTLRFSSVARARRVVGREAPEVQNGCES